MVVEKIIIVRSRPRGLLAAWLRLVKMFGSDQLSEFDHLSFVYNDIRSLSYKMGCNRKKKKTIKT